MRMNLQEIEDIVGADNVSAVSETIGLYSRDIAALPGLAFQIIDNKFHLIAQPQTIKSLATLIRYANDRKIPIVPRGSGTSGWGGALPTRGGICISSHHLTKFVHIDEYRMLVTVEAGMTWKDLLIFIEQLGMTLPVYPSSAAAATVGGFVASGGIGIGSTKYGDVREQVLGIEAVLPDGRVVRLGDFHTNPQDTTEYIDEAAFIQYLHDEGIPFDANPMDLFLGTFGTFGYISRITLKIIPKLVFHPFACIFEDLTQLIEAVQQILAETSPYYLRALTDSYTRKRFATRSLIDEYGKFILIGCFMDNYFQIDEDMETVTAVIEKHHGTIIQQKRAEYLWEERLYPLRIKKLGPSLVPAELLIPIEKIPELYNGILTSLTVDSIAIECTINNDGQAAFLAWILDDERKRLSYTIGWYRSFDITRRGMSIGGKPYAIALWNVNHAPAHFGKNELKRLRMLKRVLDPHCIMNPMKVFGGRIRAKKESLALGFVIGFTMGFLVDAVFTAFLGQSVLFTLTGWVFMQAVGQWALALGGGILGFLFIRYLSLERALGIGVPILRGLRFLKK